MKPTLFTMLLLIILCSACEKDPDVGIYIIDIDGAMKDPTGYLIEDAVTDYDGNNYSAVIIGDQVWMAENLRTTHYADGTSIPHGNCSSETSAYWYYPNNSSSNKPTYGLLYNWKAVITNSNSNNAQGICPTGWHVPSDAEWKQMEIAMGMSRSDADNTGWRGNIAAQLCGNTGWQSSTTSNAAGNTSATGRNSSGFSALPSGCYYGDSYNEFGYFASFWSTTEESGTFAWMRDLTYDNSGMARYRANKSYGFSVRCVKD